MDVDTRADNAAKGRCRQGSKQVQARQVYSVKSIVECAAKTQRKAGLVSRRVSPTHAFAHNQHGWSRVEWQGWGLPAPILRLNMGKSKPF